MKANELMIGDWVEVIQNGNPAYAQIQMIDGYGDNATYNECICDGIYYNINEIKPIPLTTEILELNGWQYGYWEDEYENDEYFTNETIGFDLHINDKKEFEIRCVDAVNITLKFVHELQNALRLCGIDKEIVL